MEDFYYQLVDAKGNPVSTVDAVSLEKNKKVFHFRDAIWQNWKDSQRMHGVAAGELLVYANEAALEADIAANKPLTGLKPGRKVDTLGDTDDDHPILIVVPERGQATTSVRRNTATIDRTVTLDGVNLNGFYLHRIPLLTELNQLLNDNQVVVVASPAGSGKTSLFQLLSRERENCVRVSCLASGFNFETFVSALGGGKLFDGRHEYLLDATSHYLIWLDDAQATYNNIKAWASLVKDVIVKFPRLRLVISATHLLEGQQESPVELASLRRLKREDFRISSQEALDMLRAPPPFGLPNGYGTQLIENIIINESNGLIAAVRLSIDAIKQRFVKNALPPPETNIVQYYFSQDFLPEVNRCFGSKQSAPVDSGLRTFLQQCLICPDDLEKPTFEDDKTTDHLSLLMKVGLLVEVVSNKFAFSSPLAKRYYCRWLFPKRSPSAPANLKVLMKQAISDMSSAILRSSSPGGVDFPKEATFQHLFMQSLAASTPPSCAICPELSTVFPERGEEPSERIAGAIDFYLNGQLRWGVELLRKGDKIGKHMDRFSPSGPYHPLRVNDYVVVDFRQGSFSARVDRYEHRLSVFFAPGDFSSCQFVFGHDAPLILNLS
ncbi:hypothetical protein DFS34DRAFT_690284 [Phlyctochytrium arcticum]|nr:hypothetical protein DFS34DRAFT_690284 [Phlyctochytrium arcticum]